MNKLYTSFLELVRKINDDALKVFDDALTYILRYLSIDTTDAVWPHGESVATHALQRGMPIDEVRIMLGHDSIATTTIYAQTLKDNIKDSHEKYV